MEAYEKAGEEVKMAGQKMALLRCTLKLFEAMERQHTHLLATIEDVEDYRKRMARLKQLEQLIEGNRASPESRLQAKLAYEHFTLGPLPRRPAETVNY